MTMLLSNYGEFFSSYVQKKKYVYVLTLLPPTANSAATHTHVCTSAPLIYAAGGASGG